MTPLQKARMIERERLALEKKLNKLTGVHVDIKASVHNVPDDTKTRPLAHAALRVKGWRAEHHGGSAWVESIPRRTAWGGVGNTVIFVTPRISELIAGVTP